mmetsp:Transcript_53861/g.99550  ORF Transcript_53861/g.99550 Transcript_53861/m.99550 type:complete len:361 (+) Transcript_53861:104-1186(+)
MEPGLRPDLKYAMFEGVQGVCWRVLKQSKLVNDIAPPQSHTMSAASQAFEAAREVNDSPQPAAICEAGDELVVDMVQLKDDLPSALQKRADYQVKHREEYEGSSISKVSIDGRSKRIEFSTAVRAQFEGRFVKHRDEYAHACIPAALSLAPSWVLAMTQVYGKGALPQGDAEKQVEWIESAANCLPMHKSMHDTFDNNAPSFSRWAWLPLLPLSSCVSYNGAAEYYAMFISLGTFPTLAAAQGMGLWFAPAEPLVRQLCNDLTQNELRSCGEDRDEIIDLLQHQQCDGTILVASQSVTAPIGLRTRALRLLGHPGFRGLRNGGDYSDSDLSEDEDEVDVGRLTRGCLKKHDEQYSFPAGL